jgi:hypothetical protein
VFDDIDAMVEAAVAEAEQLAQTHRHQADHARAELDQVDRESASIASLLVDPDVLAEPMAKKAILRKSAEIEARREMLQASLAKIMEQTNANTDRLSVRCACNSASISFEPCPRVSAHE